MKYILSTVLDLDKDGFISAEELQHALTKTGDTFTDAEIKELIKIADTNKDGKIDYNGRYMYVYGCWSTVVPLQWEQRERKHLHMKQK